ncbi:MAG: hypothetical protein ABTQ34_09325 [Bdellovibrionales bacterium]
MMRKAFLAGIVALLIGAMPVLAQAKDDAASAEGQAPVAESRSGRFETALPNETTPNPSLAMANSSLSSGELADFGPSSGTVVGNRAIELRDQIMRMRASVNLNANEFAILRSSGAAGAVQYHSTVAAITARLQNGTTRGNPILLRQWDEANASLDEVTSSLNRLNSLQTAIDADASLASYLLESVQAAFQLSGAVDEDHDQLKILRDEVSRLVVQLDYLRNQTAGDIQRQTTYLNAERSNLQALAFAISRGELLGSSLANRPVIVSATAMATLPPPPAPQTPAMTSAPRDAVQSSAIESKIFGHSANATAANSATTFAPSLGHLLVLIRYDHDNVKYEQQLSQAVANALARRPGAEFSVVAVAPADGNPADLAKSQERAQRYSDDVKRSLVQLGLQPSRISMSSTQTQTAQVPEVHLYVR